jgi:hypothetical protein
MRLQPLRWLLKAPSEPQTAKRRHLLIGLKAARLSGMFLYFAAQLLRWSLRPATPRSSVRKSRTARRRQTAIEAGMSEAVVLEKTVAV